MKRYVQSTINGLMGGSYLNVGEYGVIGWTIGDEELHPFELDEGRSGSDILLPHVDAHIFPTIL